MLLFREYLMNYVQSDRFKSLVIETNKIITGLSSILYCVRFRDLSVQVRNFKFEINYTEEIEETFTKFKHDQVKDYRVNYSSDPMDMNHVEAQILDGVAHLYPEIFSQLDTFFAGNQDYLDETIAKFDREIQFYIAYLDYIRILRKEGLKFCYPQITKESREVYNYEGFDLALAQNLISEKSSVVVNDFYLKGIERIIVVSGPNQGGKTTFARTFGQLHFLSCLGCPVPGSKAQLFLFDRLFTHFEKEENIKNLRGKLQDDLVRIHNILNQATSDTIIVMNEVFTSTALQDQVFLSRNIMESIIELDMLCVWVTFIDELASCSNKTVSMISTVFPDNPSSRTFKIIRGPADGLAYAMSIAEKYSLSYDYLKERLKL
jgi:DNA mismatch repair ATPase MutS